MAGCELILLAAGFSRRYGSNKLLAPWKGKPMYCWTLEKLEALTAEHPDWSCLVVTQYPEIEADCLEQGILCLHNSGAEEGIASSIRLALSRAEEEYAAFFVADQPEMTLETLQGFLTGFFASGKGLGCLSSKGRLGNPCVFSKAYFPQLLTLRGDRGGKAVLQRHPEDLYQYEVSNPAELEDIDTP